MVNTTRVLALALLAAAFPIALPAQLSPRSAGWFFGGYLGGTVGNFEIDHIANVGAGAFDLGGAIGIGAGRLWRWIGVAAGGELQMLLDQSDRGTDAAQANRSAPGLSSLRLDVLVPLEWARDGTFETAFARTNRLLLVGGISATRVDGALATGTVSVPVAGAAEIRGVGWSFGGQWLRALGESQWLVLDVRGERFRVTSGRIDAPIGQPDGRTPSGGGTSLVVRVGTRLFFPVGPS
jgi:hypothetical protein